MDIITHLFLKVNIKKTFFCFLAFAGHTHRNDKNFYHFNQREIIFPQIQTIGNNPYRWSIVLFGGYGIIQRKMLLY